jgi:hypothetical protein
VSFAFGFGVAAMNSTRPKTLRQHWKQGFFALAYAYVTLLIASIPFTIGRSALSLLDSWPAVEIIFGLVFLVTLVVVVPLLVSKMGIDRQAAREQLVSALEPHVDRLAAQAGLSWEGHYLSEVAELLQKGETDQARKVYHDRAGVNWDQADQAMADWAGTVLAEKLKLLGEGMRKVGNQGSAG